MITLLDYFGTKKDHHDASPDKWVNAEELLERVNTLLDEARGAGLYGDWIDEDTGTNISGSKGGSGDGGFRLHDSKTGALNSPHKEGKAVDIYDPENKLDLWLTDAILSRHGLFREHPEKTRGWVHVQTKAPKSGRRTFYP